MATQTHEQDLLIETKQEAGQTIDVCQEVKEKNLGASAVHLLSGAQKAFEAKPDLRDGSLGSSITNILAGLANKLAVVLASLSNPPSTERGRIRNAMFRGRHDRFISFLR